ncbi:MAG: hypothetical protein EPO65_10150 [Dehalococcoidia bacterium]|nr:MAG: hypothetical protein EPO65_10150 [Dehalococcoidia bacterium]
MDEGEAGAMRGMGGAVITFLIALSLGGTALQRSGGGAHEFDLGPAPPILAGQIYAIDLKAPGGVRTARNYPRFNAVFLTRGPSGNLTAFPNVTPEAGCLLIFRAPTVAQPPAFTDPCEGGVWDARGTYVSGREKRDLLRLPLTVTDAGRLVIDTLDVAEPPSATTPATPEATPAPDPYGTPIEPAPAQWVLVPTVASPLRSDRGGLTGAADTLARQWGLAPRDVGLLGVSAALILGAGALAAGSYLRRDARRASHAAVVYVEWRTRRRWQQEPDPPITLYLHEERRIAIRLVNAGKATATGLTVTFEAEEPIALDLESRTGEVSRSLLPTGAMVRWMYGRAFPSGARSAVASLRVGRVDDTQHVAITRTLTVRCQPGEGGQETRARIHIRLT